MIATFDGDAISRADREFLASLGDQPLARNPLYSVPPPTLPDYDALPAGRAEGARSRRCQVVPVIASQMPRP